MAVLIDTPLWPAHGTVFCHLVSDSSLEQLHDLAERAGLPPGAFDRDHYDVPARLHQACVDAGALPTPMRELAARLRASGLRRAKHDVATEVAARRHRLLAVWPLPEHHVAEQLLDAWNGPGRYYHDLRHLEEALSAADDLGNAERATTLAIWFHDAVYEGHPGGDEEASARLAERTLTDLLPAAEVAEVARLVRLTAGHAPALGDARGEVLCDADLSILGRDVARYDVYRRDVRREYADVPLPEYRRGRAAVLRHLAGLQPLYRTPAGRELWSAQAEANLDRELSLFEAP